MAMPCLINPATGRAVLARGRIGKLLSAVGAKGTKDGVTIPESVYIEPPVEETARRFRGSKPAMIRYGNDNTPYVDNRSNGGASIDMNQDLPTISTPGWRSIRKGGPAVAPPTESMRAGGTGAGWEQAVVPARGKRARTDDGGGGGQIVSFVTSSGEPVSFRAKKKQKRQAKPVRSKLRLIRND